HTFVGSHPGVLLLGGLVASLSRRPAEGQGRKAQHARHRHPTQTGKPLHDCLPSEVSFHRYYCSRSARENGRGRRIFREVFKENGLGSAQAPTQGQRLNNRSLLAAFLSEWWKTNTGGLSAASVPAVSGSDHV